jgi:VWFA-related protein
VALAGCLPHQIEKQLDGENSQLVPPKDYKPVYTTSTVSLKKLLEKQGAAIGDSTFKTGDIAANIPPENSLAPNSSYSNFSLLKTEIRGINDRNYPDEVELRVLVSDTSGRFVRGLAPPNFAGAGEWRRYWPQLWDSCSGVNHQITDFTVTEVRDDSRLPYAVAFVLDHSPSMGETRALNLQKAIAKTLNIIRDGDMISVIKFTKNITVEVPLTGDSASFKKLFKTDGLKDYDGGTAIYDGVNAGIEQINKAPENFKKAIILFTDGGDNSSGAKLDSVVRFAKANETTIYTIAYGMTEDEPLRNLAHYSGGRFYRIYSSKEFPYVFADIYRSLSNYYKVTYRPPQCAALHTANVTVRIPELGAILKASGQYDKTIFNEFDAAGSIAFVNIEFESGKSEILPESTPRVQEIADILLKNNSLKLEIRGHTDDVGSDDANMKLSEARAQSVRAELLKMGISASRLTAKGFGESRPLVENNSEVNRRKNRRTEFVIISR